LIEVVSYCTGQTQWKIGITANPTTGLARNTESVTKNSSLIANRTKILTIIRDAISAVSSAKRSRVVETGVIDKSEVSSTWGTLRWRRVKVACEARTCLTNIICQNAVRIATETYWGIISWTSHAITSRIAQIALAVDILR
jgi:hypothetical protein